MTSKRKAYFRYLKTTKDYYQRTKQIGRRMVILHIKGHPNCTPNHTVFTSNITKIYKNGNFETQNTHWFLIR